MKSPIHTLVLTLAVVVVACSNAPIDTLVSPTPTALATQTQTSVPTTSPVPSPTTTPSPTLNAGTYATRLAGQLRQVLNSRRTSMDIPGMTAAIIFPDGSIWSAASGLAEVSPARAAEVSTPFVAGSITKTFVAATLLQLEEEGALELDDPLSDWLPSYPRAGEITLRQLLSHYSGVFNLFESRKYTRLVIREGAGREWTPQEVLDELGGEPYCDPGDCYHYSNTGFVLLGMVIEAATGESFGSVLRERFWAPLGMSATYFQGDGPPPASSARGYVPTASGDKAVTDDTDYRPTKSEATVVFAAGGVVSTCDDLARWGDALYGGDVLTPDSLAELTEYVEHPDGAYALGTRTRTYQDIRMFGHTGALRGFNAAMWHLRSLDATVVVMTNLTRIDANRITDALLSVVVPAVQ